MAFIRLTKTVTEQPVWINVDQIVGVWREDDGTHVLHNNPGWWVVRESPERVIALADEAIRNDWRD